MDLDRLAARAKVGEPGAPTPRALALLRRVVGPIVRMAYRPTLEGTDHLPASGAFLLVANHSGAVGAAEILSFAALYVERFGTSRPLAGFAHPFGFRVWPVSSVLQGLGAIPSTYAAGESALSAGIPILVFPGGDHEVARPIWLANEVDFGGRKGFLKLARRAWVPIVPLGFRGAHFTAPVLWRSRLAAYLFGPRLLGVKRYPLTLLAVAGAIAVVLAFPQLGWWRFLIAYGWLSSPLATVPWVPWSIRARIGARIAPEELFGERDASDAADLDRALEQVEAAVRALVRQPK